MLSKKSKGLYLDINRHSVHAAITTSLLHPFSIEDVREIPFADVNAFHALVEEVLDVKAGRFLACHAAVYPKSRFFRKHTLESAAKVKEPDYFANVLSNQFRIDGRRNSHAVINVQSGLPFDVGKPVSTQKEVLFCGAESGQLDKLQDWIVESSAVPSTLQLGTNSIIGGLRKYCSVSLLSREVFSDCTVGFQGDFRALAWACVMQPGCFTVGVGCLCRVLVGLFTRGKPAPVGTGCGLGFAPWRALA